MVYLYYISCLIYTILAGNPQIFYVHVLHLYVSYDYVQRCEDTVSVELSYVN